MTRTFTGKRLLENGPMSLRQFSEALGVDAKLASSTLCQLIKTGVVQRATAPGFARYVYRLA